MNVNQGFVLPRNFIEYLRRRSKEIKKTQGKIISESVDEFYDLIMGLYKDEKSYTTPITMDYEDLGKIFRIKEETCISSLSEIVRVALILRIFKESFEETLRNELEVELKLTKKK